LLVSLHLGESPVAGIVRRAFFEHSLERALGTLRKIIGHELIRRSHALKNNRPHVLGMLSQVNQSRTRAVGAAKNIYLLVTEGGPHVVEIIRGNRSCVEQKVRGRLQFATALLHLFEREEITEVTLRVIRIEKRAVERVRAAGATLIEEHQIVLLTDLGEYLRYARRIFSGGRAGAAGDIEQWIRSTFTACRRQRHNFETNLAALSRGAVFKDFEISA
jgi:hypothetical protein